MATRQDIKLHFKRLALEKGFIVTTPGPNRGKVARVPIMQRSGISETTLQKWFQEPDGVQGIRLDSLARMCELLSCGVGDLIEFAPVGARAYSRPEPVLTPDDLGQHAHLPGQVEAGFGLPRLGDADFEDS